MGKSEDAYRARMLVELKADEGHRFHGTATGYSCGCRCERCREAHSAAWKRQKAARKRRDADLAQEYDRGYRDGYRDALVRIAEEKDARK